MNTEFKEWLIQHGATKEHFISLEKEKVYDLESFGEFSVEDLIKDFGFGKTIALILTRAAAKTALATTKKPAIASSPAAASAVAPVQYAEQPDFGKFLKTNGVRAMKADLLEGASVRSILALYRLNVDELASLLSYTKEQAQALLDAVEETGVKFISAKHANGDPLQGDAFAAWAKEHGVSEQELKQMQEKRFACTRVLESQHDTTDLHVQAGISHSLAIILIRAAGGPAPPKNQQKGNFGIGGAYAEHGTAIATQVNHK